VLITTVVKDLWDSFWNSVVPSKLAVDTTAIQSMPGFYIPRDTIIEGMSLLEATEAMEKRLPGYRWWIDWVGSDTLILRFEQGEGELGGPGVEKVIPTSAPNHQFMLEPQNEAIRNRVIVTGALPGGVDGDGVPQPDRPITTAMVDAASISAFGELTEYIEDKSLNTIDAMRQRAEYELGNRAWEFWQTAMELQDFALRPGHLVELAFPESLPTPGLGIDGTNFNDFFSVDETRDVVERGRLNRVVTFREVRFT
jgi:hypothetical protein